jgi:hypothetical protein
MRPVLVRFKTSAVKVRGASVPFVKTGNVTDGWAKDSGADNVSVVPLIAVIVLVSY